MLRSLIISTISLTVLLVGLCIVSMIHTPSEFTKQVEAAFESSEFTEADRSALIEQHREFADRVERAPSEFKNVNALVRGFIDYQAAKNGQREYYSTKYKDLAVLIGVELATRWGLPAEGGSTDIALTDKRLRDFIQLWRETADALEEAR